MSRPLHYNKAYKTRLLDKIKSLDGQVLTRRDLSRSRSNQEQLRLNRALKAFIDDGLIIKISHGLYAKAMIMNLPDGKKRTVLQHPFEDVVIEALNKLKVKWELGHAIQEYNRGETTQIPAVFSVQLRSRFRGTISANGRTVIFEDKIYAR
jgi:ribosomal protein L21E